MGILESILKESGGALVGQIAQNFGIDKKTAEAAISGLAPAITRGLQRNTQSEKGMGSLLDALKRGSHDRVLEDHSFIGLDETNKEGNDILGHIFGSKDVSRNVAGATAKESGLSAGMLKKMLPMVAMMVMGMMGRKSKTSTVSKQSGGAGGLITNMLDSDNDGSILDDVLNMAVKFF